jgi:hypothetical protein
VRGDNDLARGCDAGTRQRKEGIVVRPLSTAASPPLDGRLSCKVISNAFLRKEEARHRARGTWPQRIRADRGRT